MPLFHFSDNPDIEVFVPRPVLVPSDRGPGRDWLNGPLVWAIDEHFQAMYLFPRDCPRIVLFAKADSSRADLDLWFGDRDCHAIAHIEWDWLEWVLTTPIHRYTLPTDSFESLHDAGLYVSRTPVTPLAMQTFDSLGAAMRELGVELRVMARLTPLWNVWSTSLHASGVRLRNAQGWAEEAARRGI